MKFWQQEQDLQKFDHYYFYNGYQGTKITREIVEGFIYVKGESCNSWRRKEVLLRNFGMYLKDFGFEPYIPEVKTPEGRTPYIPHIYTKEELHRFLRQLMNILIPGLPPGGLWTLFCFGFYTAQASVFPRRLI